MTSALAGKRVLVTRERLGELGAMLAGPRRDRRACALDRGSGRRTTAVPRCERELGRLADHDWLIVTSAAGAERVGAAARRAPGVRLAAVGTATARALGQLAGRAVDLVPPVQTGAALAAAFVELGRRATARILVVQADRAISGPGRSAHRGGPRRDDVCRLSDRVARGRSDDRTAQ